LFAFFCLALHRRGNPTSDRELSQEYFERCRFPVGDVALAVDPDEAFNQIDVGVLRPDALVFKENVSDEG
jgi:hypothetical protein